MEYLLKEWDKMLEPSDVVTLYTPDPLVLDVNQTFWVGLFPGLEISSLDHICNSLAEACAGKPIAND